ncbi:MAG: replicative DNA helicase [Xanthobacteraceae bacterium]|nr:replicative DNA helicase [Xanthobacteraceae bacterium]
MPNDHQDPLPGNIEIEQGLIGALLLNNDALDQIGDELEPRHFAEPLHAAIYDIAAAMIGEGRVVTPTTIRPFLPAGDIGGGMTVAQYLARLAAEATSVLNAADYARSIAELAARRALIAIGQEMIATAHHAPFDMPASAQIEEAERRLTSLAEAGRSVAGGAAGFAPFAEAASAAMNMAAHACQRDGSLTGLATGIRDLDAKMGGLQPSDLIIVAGRPGMGKTALATNIATHIASSGHEVGFFSLEMSSEQLATRIIAERAGIPSSAIRRGAVTNGEFARLADAAARHRAMPLSIDQTGGLSIGKLCARARRLHRRHGLDLLVVDYIQLLAGNARRFNDSRVQEVAEITTGLKALAKELNVPVVALSQLSRAVETREDKRPQLSDLRESGSIEQDADVVLFVFREEYYLAGKEPRPGSAEHLSWQAEMEAASGRAELIIGKQRHGPTGTVAVRFDARVTRFGDLAEESMDHL